jgi:hypothetical protein
VGPRPAGARTPHEVWRPRSRHAGRPAARRRRGVDCGRRSRRGGDGRRGHRDRASLASRSGARRPAPRRARSARSVVAFAPAGGWAAGDASLGRAARPSAETHRLLRAAAPARRRPLAPRRAGAG